ncbi:F-box protein At4g00755 isoform X2 [Hevea brasiliensis]|uniref:F-box protein At4g00755 isoform X2 n=1 Tax=Hevea brasiliensis TaxID=3981 RepID=UPI000B7806EE|nr:F-box protein At4g00755 isoform X2 [Hevea brasiliensis]
METRVDFFSWLDYDMLMRILMCLEDPSDLVRVSSVSRSWREFEVGCSKSVEWETLEREHRVYAFLARGCTLFARREDCIAGALSASSTDNYPEESIRNTLEPHDRVLRRASYWSSKGQSNPAVPETLTYKLVADICVITEISVRPFQAFFQWGSPIYSAKSVRFRMGHPKAPVDDPMGEPCDNFADDNFVWTYTSPEFAMAQENRLQKFELPEPVLCIGGILQVELLGRVQKQEMDGLFYICVSHVQVVGRPLSPPFSVEILEPSGKFVLKASSYTPPLLAENGSCPGPNAYFEGPARDLEQILHLLRGEGVVVEYDWNEEDELDDEMAL